MRSRRNRTWRWLVGVTCGGVFVLSGCDPAVRDTILNGVGTAATSLATTFIQAFVTSLVQQGQDQGAQTVRANTDLPVADIFA